MPPTLPSRTSRLLQGLACAAGLGALLGVGLAPLHAQEQLVMKLASREVWDSPTGQQLGAFARWVQERSHGAVRVKLLLGGRLGEANVLVRRTAEASLQGFAGTAHELAQVVPELEVLQAPGVLSDRAKLDARLDGPVRARLHALLPRHDLQFGFWSAGSFRAWVSRDASAAGRGDAFDIEVLEALASERAQDARQLTLCEHAYVPRLVVYSKRWFDGLPEQVQKDLTTPPEALVRDARAAATTANAEAARLLETAGVKLHTCSAAEHRTSVQQARSTTDALARSLGAEALSLLSAARD